MIALVPQLIAEGGGLLGEDVRLPKLYLWVRPPGRSLSLSEYPCSFIPHSAQPPTALSSFISPSFSLFVINFSPSNTCPISLTHTHTHPPSTLATSLCECIPSHSSQLHPNDWTHRSGTKRLFPRYPRDLCALLPDPRQGWQRAMRPHCGHGLAAPSIGSGQHPSPGRNAGT